jgi:hypothetical protein
MSKYRLRRVVVNQYLEWERNEWSHLETIPYREVYKLPVDRTVQLGYRVGGTA